MALLVVGPAPLSLIHPRQWFKWGSVAIVVQVGALPGTATKMRRNIGWKLCLDMTLIKVWRSQELVGSKSPWGRVAYRFTVRKGGGGSVHFNFCWKKGGFVGGGVGGAICWSVAQIRGHMQ